MIIKIIGWLWLSTGIILVIMPGILRWQIQNVFQAVGAYSGSDWICDGSINLRLKMIYNLKQLYSESNI